MRIGHGYDVHKIDPEKDAVILGGVRIPCGFGLLAHSDGDVLLHALTDALLGAAGMRDIGALFPDSDAQYRGISSLILLEEALRQIREKGFSVSYADTTVIAQRPKLSAYIEEIRSVTARAMGIPRERFNVKATTEEGLGFTGRGEGIAAHAVCLLEENIL